MTANAKIYFVQVSHIWNNMVMQGCKLYTYDEQRRQKNAREKEINVIQFKLV